MVPDAARAVRALLEEAAHLVRAGALQAVDDVLYLRFEELREAVRTRRVDHALVAARKEAFRSSQALTPPRVLTSRWRDARRLLPAQRRAGRRAGRVCVSAGVVEGRARGVFDMEHADLAAGDVLVTAYTDPGWTRSSSPSPPW